MMEEDLVINNGALKICWRLHIFLSLFCVLFDTLADEDRRSEN